MQAIRAAHTTTPLVGLMVAVELLIVLVFAAEFIAVFTAISIVALPTFAFGCKMGCTWCTR